MCQRRDLGHRATCFIEPELARFLQTVALVKGAGCGCGCNALYLRLRLAIAQMAGEG